MRKVKKKQTNIKLNKKYHMKLIIFLLFLLACTAFYAFKSIPRKIELEYTITPYSVEKRILNVKVKIKPLQAGTNKTFVLVKGSMLTSDEKCTDDLNRDVKFNSENGIIVMDQLNEGANYLNFSYNVTIGGAGKHGENGQVYQDLLTFAGESVLALPLRALNYDSPKEDVIKKITVQCLLPNTWEAIIPYPRQGDKAVTEIDNPAWMNLYELRQGTFTFGKFEKDVHTDSNGKGYTVYLDSQAKKYYDSNAEKGIESIYNYYSKLFNYNLNNYSLVILRKDDESKNYIIGGLCTQNLASSFDPGNKRDWQLLSHRIFHSFFESKIPSERYLKAPLLEFYEGLATYYENMALGSLPDNIKTSLDISPQKEMSYLFERYAYMRLKDSKNLSLTPLNEVQLQQSPGRIEFLHYTQMPLTVDYMEKLINENTGKKDNILNYIIENSKDDSVTVEKIATSLLGKDSNNFTTKYLNGHDILPLWGYINNKNESDKNVINRLNEYEFELYTWFSLEDQLYQYDFANEADLVKLSKEAEKEGAEFADQTTENTVKDASPTIYNLLKEYALRAKVCSLDFNDSSIREKLLSNKSNLDKWDAFKKSLK
ncbi:MAG: hypothetical protein K0R54_2303 [Clostridiaceae bacterium]|jgi:hypothetical protein|nr:hypothetical protein [Clostridiaceae bacterium]